MEFTFSTLGAIMALVISIVLIIFKFQATYSLIIGAIIGGIIGGGDLVNTVNAMVSGAEGMMSSVLRIMTSGILAGALVKTGSAEKIADTIIDKLGDRLAIVSISISTMIICAIGVFVDISVITIAPIALVIAYKLKINKMAVLIAMIGGGKAGNIISPNPNTIATAESFKIQLTDLMLRNLIPAIIALVVTIIIAILLSKKESTKVVDSELEKNEEDKLPNFINSIIGPLCVVILLSLRPLFDINIDPLVALPLGGIIVQISTGNLSTTRENFTYGFMKISSVCALLIGTGTIAGIIKSSNLQTDILALIDQMNLPTFILAPISGIFMAAATASTTAGATVASQTFYEALKSSGIDMISAGAMLHAGSTVLDSLPHGSFFHATAGSVNMNIKNRMKLIPFEMLIGLSSTISAIVIYFIAN
ncbi:MAG: GntP family permease [Tissierellia bacterium]|nr:GntP family permease [Tissierellia bacterium]